MITCLHKRILFFLCCLAPLVFLAQVKSTNIQTIEGKKYYLHKIEKGQSLYAITKLYNVTLEDLYMLNPDLKAGAKANQEIKVPFNGSVAQAVSTGSATPIDTAKFVTYKISKSETVYSVCKKFNLTEKQLNTYNPSLAQGLKEGQILVVGERAKKRSTAKENKESKTSANKDKQIAAAKDKTVTPVDSSLLKPPSKPKKTSYNIALILPFKLDETLNLDLNEMAHNNTNFPEVPGLAIDFYLGFKRAVDSLSGKDYELNLELYDIDDKDSLRIIELISSSKFKELDFIFGPLYANSFKTISKRAKELHIPIVSPITQQNKIVYNNIFVSKTNPSQFTLLESLADYCVDSLLKANGHIMLLSAFEKDRREAGFVSAFKKRFNERQRALGKSTKDSISVVKGIAGIKASFIPNVKNVIVSLSSNEVFIADFTTQLAMFADKKDIVLCGWESLGEMDNIDQEYLNQLNFTFPHQHNLLNAASYGPVINSYIAQQDIYPSEYYFMGFDIALYYLKNLKELGPDFVYNLNNLPAETNYLRFKFMRPDNTTGFDNRGVFIFNYNNYQLQKTGWK